MSIETVGACSAKQPSRMSGLNDMLDKITKQLEELGADVNNLETNLLGDRLPEDSGKECRERGSGHIGRILIALDRYSEQITEIHSVVLTIVDDCS